MPIIPSLRTLAAFKVPFVDILDTKLHLDTALPEDLCQDFKRRFTLQTLYDENLFNDDLDPELVYECLNKEQRLNLWYFLGYRQTFPNDPFANPEITPERRQEGLRTLRDFLLFFVQHPGQLLEASSGCFHSSYRYVWAAGENGFYFFTSTGNWMQLGSNHYKTIDDIVDLLFVKNKDRVTWTIVPTTIIPDKEKKALQALHAISEIDYDLSRQDLRRTSLNVEQKLQFAIHPLINAEKFRMIGDYLYITTENDVFYYHQDDGDLILTILEYNVGCLHIST